MSRERLFSEMNDEGRFYALVDEFESYMYLAAAAGPHSYLGKFYRREARRRETVLADLITSLVTAAGYPEFGFETVYMHHLRILSNYIRPIDLVMDIVEAGGYQAEDDWDFRDVVTVGAMQMSYAARGRPQRIERRGYIPRYQSF